MKKQDTEKLEKKNRYRIRAEAELDALRKKSAEIREKAKSSGLCAKVGAALSGTWVLFLRLLKRIEVRWPLLKEFIVFWLLSNAVTVFQYLMFTILPYVFGMKLASTEFMWPQVDITLFGFTYKWNILGYDVARNAAGAVVIGGGLGYFLAYNIGTFLAQCINFPLQRNITFKSDGNPWWQAMWYFIGWLGVTFLCNALNALWMPLGQKFLPLAVYNILVTVITGGVSMLIFFFIFKIIFPHKDDAEEA